MTSEREDAPLDYRMFVAKSGWQWLKERSFLEILMVLQFVATCTGLYCVGMLGIHFEDQHTKQIERISSSFDKALDRMASVSPGGGPEYRFEGSKVAGKVN